MINVYVSSVTGNTLTFVENFLKENTKTELNVVRDLRSSSLIGNTIAIGCSTWGDGKIPTTLKKWLIANKDELANKNILIFGSGYTLFQHYCKAVDSVDLICTQSGANTFLKLKFEQVWNPNEFSEQELNQIREEIKKWEETYYA